MGILRVRLFGELDVATEDQTFAGLAARKAQELFCYLLLYRDREHARETLAGLLWGESATAQARTYLRKTLWQLGSALAAAGQPTLLRATAERIQLQVGTSLWLDVAILEQVASVVRNRSGATLDPGTARALAEAVTLYRGDLLGTWDQEWCRAERARLQALYLQLLTQLMEYHEHQQQYQAAIACGEQVLHWQPGCEETHQRLMRLRYVGGDRSGALRQYAQCVATLAAEFNAAPTADTTRLYDQIRTNQLGSPPAEPVSILSPDDASPSLPSVLARLRHLEAVVAEIQQQLQVEIHQVESALDRARRPARTPIPQERFEIREKNASGYAQTTQ